MAKNVKGRIHSIESFGTVDGPGVRYVLFMQGCPLRCQYCHNPDSWNYTIGSEVDSDSVVDDIKRYYNFIRKGGVTLSGGEPLLQSEFVSAVIDGCHAEGIHVAIDTSGALPLSVCREPLEKADLILLDIKGTTPKQLKKVTGCAENYAEDFLKLRDEINMPVWIRYVLVPNLTMEDKLIHQLGELLSRYKCVDRVELLPFHQLGSFKWEEIGEEYLLKETQPPSAQEVDRVRRILTEEYNLPM